MEAWREAMDRFNPEKLSLPKEKARIGNQPRKPPRHKPGDRFLKGPIPWGWLSEAARLPGRTLHVAIGLWHLAGITKNRTVRLSRAVAESLGVNRHVQYRGLKALEESNLVSVERLPGRRAVVTILDGRNQVEQGTENERAK
jgi:hypothetical protein